MSLRTASTKSLNVWVLKKLTHEQMSPTTVVVCLCGLLRLRCRVVGVGHLPLKHFWHPHHRSTVTVLPWWGCQKWQTLTLHAPAIRTCWKKRFFKMGIVETCHTHKFYRHLFFWFLYFTFLKLPPPPRAAILVGIYFPFGYCFFLHIFWCTKLQLDK